MGAGAAAAQDDLDYPLGELRFPPVTEPADPLRLVDLRVLVEEERSTNTSFEARLKLRETGFFGAEVRGERLGAFFDTQRLELGIAEEDGRLALEGAYRAPWFRVAVDADKRRNDTWTTGVDGSIRLNPDFEILVSGFADSDDSRNEPPSLEDFIETNRLPPLGRRTRIRSSWGTGFLYQRGTKFDLRGELSRASIRTEAGFDQMRSRLGASAVWNHVPFEIDGRFVYDDLSGPVGRREGLAEVGGTFHFAHDFVATGRALERWQPGVERFVREYRFGLTFYGRHFSFVRDNEASEETLRLTRRANELGYNERRVYTIEGLRALRERLSISAARDELATAIDALYRAEVRQRNVPQLGVGYGRFADELLGTETEEYRVFIGVPWRSLWPWARSESHVEFVRLQWRFSDVRFPSVGIDAPSHEVSVDVELNRENIVRFVWNRPGQTPQDIALRIERGTSVRLDYVYALGR